MRDVFTADAITWLTDWRPQAGHAFLGSLPDYSEFPQLTLDEWKGWFMSTAELILDKTSPGDVTIFFQSDIRHEGEWVDKGFLVQKAAEKVGAKLLWHKVACRAPLGQATFGRPGYSHILCFSRSHRLDQARSTADVLPELGDKTWVRGMGLAVCLQLARFIKEQTPAHTLVQPFCGEGAMLAAANHYGLNGIGVEKSRKRAERARLLSVQKLGQGWDLGV